MSFTEINSDNAFITIEMLFPLSESEREKISRTKALELIAEYQVKLQHFTPEKISLYDFNDIMNEAYSCLDFLTEKGLITDTRKEILLLFDYLQHIIL